MSAENSSEILDSLSPQQASVVNRVLNGENIFLTGGAGTGKSHVIHAVVQAMHDREKTVILAASTGIAAVNIGGITLHSALGLGLADEPIQDLIAKARRWNLAKKWKTVDLLIIDEISMVSPEFFEKVEAILTELLIDRRRRRLALPPSFGGLQVMVCGDFFQLPPVIKHDPDTPNPENDEIPMEFCFQHPEFQRAFPPQNTVILNQIFRQESPEFAGMLSRIRVGDYTEDDAVAVNSRVGAEITPPHGILPTVMYSHRADVDGYNSEKLDELHGDSAEYSGAFCYCLSEESAKLFIDESRRIPAAVRKKFKKVEDNIRKNAPVEITLELKPNAQVLLCANICTEAGLVNGSRGIVKKITPEGLPVVLFANGVKGVIGPYSWPTRVGKDGYVVYKQIPLRLGWAVTIHKSQGMTLDYIQIDLGSTIFTDGQAYVALSRAKSLEGVTITEFSPDSFRVNPTVKQYYSILETNAENDLPE